MVSVFRSWCFLQRGCNAGFDNRSEVFFLHHPTIPSYHKRQGAFYTILLVASHIQSSSTPRRYHHIIKVNVCRLRIWTLPCFPMILLYHNSQYKSSAIFLICGTLRLADLSVFPTIPYHLKRGQCFPRLTERKYQCHYSFPWREHKTGA